jgi:thiamine pyrophosphate-dependent acetolactate synthase large subunit-like protein
MSKRVADLLVETLQAAGVKNCYGIVGDTLNRIAHGIDTAGAMLHGEGHDVWEMVVENIP